MTKLKARARKYPGLELGCDQRPSIYVSSEALFRLETCRVAIHLARGFFFSRTASTLLLVPVGRLAPRLPHVVVSKQPQRDSRHVRAIPWPSGRWRARRRIDTGHAGRLHGRERARGHVQPRCRGGGSVGRGKGCHLRHRSGGDPPASRDAHGRGRHFAAPRTCARRAVRPTRRLGRRVGPTATRRGASKRAARRPWHTADLGRMRKEGLQCAKGSRCIMGMCFFLPRKQSSMRPLTEDPTVSIKMNEKNILSPRVNCH